MIGEMPLIDQFSERWLSGIFVLQWLLMFGVKELLTRPLQFSPQLSQLRFPTCNGLTKK